MTDDERLRELLQETAADVPATSDQTAAERLRASLAAPADGRSRRLLALAAVVTIVVGLAAVAAVAATRTSGRSTVLDAGREGGAPTTASESGTTTSAPPAADHAATPARDAPPMVIVDDDGRRVTAHFSDGREPLVHRAEEQIVHAALDVDGRHLWLTSMAGYDGTVLRRVDPSTGAVALEMKGAGYAAISPDRSRLAYTTWGPYGGTTQSVVVRELASGDERRIPGVTDPSDPERVVGSLGQMAWSPDGRRLLVREHFEDDVVWFLDLAEVDVVTDGTSLGVGRADWLSDGRLLATKYCCYGDPDVEPRHLVEIDLTGSEPQFRDRRERAGDVVAVGSGGLDTAVYTDRNNVLRRVRDGSVVARDVVAVAW